MIISKEDLTKLTEITRVSITKEDADKFILLRDMRKKYEKKDRKLLAIPDLPPDHILTMSEMQSFQSIALDQRLNTVSEGGVKDDVRSPIYFSAMDAAQWVKILLDCNALYARKFEKLVTPEDLASLPLFGIPNKTLFGTGSFKFLKLPYHCIRK